MIRLPHAARSYRDLLLALVVVAAMSAWIDGTPSSVLFAANGSPGAPGNGSGNGSPTIPGGTPLPGNIISGNVSVPVFQRFVFGPADISPATALATGDINGDGIDDAVIGGLRLGEPDANGGPVFLSKILTVFGRPHSAPALSSEEFLPSLSAKIESLSLADFDGDGRADLILAGAGDVHYAHAAADGTFGSEEILRSGVTADIPHTAVGDINGDGKLDVLMPDGGKIVIVRGNGDGTFQGATELAVPGATALVDVDTADVNGDGRADLVTYEQPDALFVYLQNSSGEFDLAQKIVIGADVSGFVVGSDIDTGDFNGDGVADVVVAGGINESWIFYGSTHGLSVPIVALGGGGDVDLGLSVADYDGDGRDDFWLGSGPYVEYFSGANPTRGTDFGGASLNYATAAGDFNGDGIPDVASIGGPTLLQFYLSGEVDTVPPDVTVPGDFTTEALSLVTFPASANDAVFGDVPVSCTPPSPFVASLGATVVTCTATDGAGNEGSAMFTVTGIDSTAPAITVPGNITVSPTTAAGAVVTYSATANDAIDPAPVVACAPPSGSTFALGTTTTVTCTATDAAHNSSSAAFTVSVRSAAALIAELQQQAAASGLKDSNLDNFLTELNKVKGNSLTPACNNLSVFIKKAGKSLPGSAGVVDLATLVGKVVGCQ